jgi:hypothetical protein
MGLRPVPGGVVQIEPDVLGPNDSTVPWQGFSPDLTKLAFTTPGLGSPVAAARMRMMGLVNWRTSNRQPRWARVVSIEFGPSRARRRAASASERPAIVLAVSSRT